MRRHLRRNPVLRNSFKQQDFIRPSPVAPPGYAPGPPERVLCRCPCGAQRVLASQRSGAGGE